MSKNEPRNWPRVALIGTLLKFSYLCKLGQEIFALARQSIHFLIFTQLVSQFTVESHCSVATVHSATFLQHQRIQHLIIVVLQCNNYQMLECTHVPSVISSG